MIYKIYTNYIITLSQYLHNTFKTHSNIMSEVYIYLGLQQNTFFFLHKISEKDKLASLSYDLNGQIMNCLINETMMRTADKRVIVYSIDTDTKKIYVTAMSHIDGKLMTYNKDDLYAQLIRCVEAYASKPTGEKTLVFSYEYTVGGFHTHEIPLEMPKELKMENLSDCSEIDSVTYYKITKEFCCSEYSL